MYIYICMYVHILPSSINQCRLSEVNCAYVWHDAYFSAIWRNAMCSIIHSNERHASFFCAMCCSVLHDSFLWVAFLMPWTCHDAFSEMQKKAQVIHVSITQVTFYRKRRTTRTTLFSLVKRNPQRILYAHTITAPSTCSHTTGIGSGFMPLCGMSNSLGVNDEIGEMPHIATHCNTLHHTAAHGSTLHHTATHTATHCNTLQHTLRNTATHCNTLQHTATHIAAHCAILQHTSIDYIL